MESAFRKCVRCGKEFVPVDRRQIYCSAKCREQAKNFNRSRTYKPKKVVYVCDRENGLMHTTKLQNRCNGLTEIPKDTSTCSFYKERK